MTTKQLAVYIGRLGLVRDSQRQVRYRVKVLDADTAYGSVRFLVEPTDGVGSCWITASNLDLADQPKSVPDE